MLPFPLKTFPGRSFPTGHSISVRDRDHKPDSAAPPRIFPPVHPASRERRQNNCSANIPGRFVWLRLRLLLFRLFFAGCFLIPICRFRHSHCRPCGSRSVFPDDAERLERKAERPPSGQEVLPEDRNLRRRQAADRKFPILSGTTMYGESQSGSLLPSFEDCPPAIKTGTSYISSP